MLRKFKAWRKHRRVEAQRRHYEALRNHALFRASNGERLTRNEREEFNLPDWTGDY